VDKIGLSHNFGHRLYFSSFSAYSAGLSEAGERQRFYFLPLTVHLSRFYAMPGSGGGAFLL